MSRLQERYTFDWNRIYGKDGYHIEYSVTDACNRNCVACSHLAPLAKRPNFVSIEEFARVTGILHKCLPDIHTFWLTGGEPTLHPEFIRLLGIAREIYPEAYIGIYSNGTTLNKHESDELFWEFIRENGIVCGITVYDKDLTYYNDLFERHDCINNYAETLNKFEEDMKQYASEHMGEPASQTSFGSIKIWVSGSTLYISTK